MHSIELDIGRVKNRDGVAVRGGGGGGGWGLLNRKNPLSVTKVICG